MSSSSNRRLAAIVAADVAQYSRLVGLDEEGTIAALRAHRAELIDPCLTEHRGRVANTAGDSLLMEFASVVDAVRCAVAIQQGIAERNGAIPAERRVIFRVGIHVGDVLAEGTDLLGDGVNIAARIEALCAPGSILLSDTAHAQVRDRLEHDWTDAGEHEVKNIARPVRVWSWQADTVAPAQDATPADDRPSIAVLAFNNMSGDPEQTYFAEGIAEDIITDLSKVSGLFVIARNSSFSYRGQSPDIRKVCRELNVRYVLEGSVRKAGNRVRINAQMIEGATGGHIWADRFDRDLADIFAVQDEVTAEIVNALEVALTRSEETERAGRRKVDPEAYDLFLRSRDRLLAFDEQGYAECRVLLEQVLEIDPEMAGAYALKSLLYSTEYLNGWNNPGPEHRDKALAVAEKGCRIDASDADCWHARALALLWKLDHTGARQAAEEGIRVNSNHVRSLVALGQIVDFTGDHLRGIDCADHGLRLDPHYHIATHLRGRALFALGRLDEAAAAFGERIVKSPNTDMSRAFLASTCGLTGQIDEARRLWAELIEINPGFTVSHVRNTLPYTTPDVLDQLSEGLKLAGLPG